MGAGLAAIGTLASSSLRAGLYTERHLAEIETARKVMAGMPSREALPIGRLTGSSTRTIGGSIQRHRRARRGWRYAMDSATHRGVGTVPIRRDAESRHDPSAEASGKMKRPNSDPSVAGFSLIEAMAALALTATIILALSSVAGQWLPNWRRGFVDLQRADLLGVGLERLSDDLSAAEYVTPSAGAPAPLFEGNASSAVFVRSAIGPDAYPHLEVVRLAEIKEDRGLAMVRMRALFAPTSLGRPRGQSLSAIR